MVRIAGCELSEKRQILIALTSIYGIGISRARYICSRLSIPFEKKISLLSDEEISRLRFLVTEFEIEGDLKRKIFLNVKRLKDIKCYRGLRHKLFLPVRGQRTRTNAKTRKKFKKK